MGSKNVTMSFISILLIFYLLLPTHVIAAGQWEGDNFNSYPVGAWVPPTNGWQSLSNRMWSITTGGVTGNALWFTPNYTDELVHSSDAFDYNLSVQIKHSLTLTSSYYASLIGRCTDYNSYYGCHLYTDTTQSPHSTRLALTKSWHEGLISNIVYLKVIEFFKEDINPNVYYTLSMRIKGSTIVATAGTVTIPTVSISYTDDGIKYGPVLMGGNVGVSSLAAVSFHPYFDNFTYKKIITSKSQPWLPLLLGN
jgi:hypothetical protein